MKKSTILVSKRNERNLRTRLEEIRKAENIAMSTVRHSNADVGQVVVRCLDCIYFLTGQ